MLTGAQRSELNDRILSTLTQIGRGMKASELAGHLQTAQRDVVGRLPVLPMWRASSEAPEDGDL